MFFSIATHSRWLKCFFVPSRQSVSMSMLAVGNTLNSLIPCLALVRVSRSVKRICGLYLKEHRSHCESRGLREQRAIPYPSCDYTVFSSSIARHCIQCVNEHSFSMVKDVWCHRHLHGYTAPCNLHVFVKHFVWSPLESLRRNHTRLSQPPCRTTSVTMFAL